MKPLHAHLVGTLRTYSASQNKWDRSTCANRKRGRIDAATGKLRVDHSMDHSFWLEVDLMPLMEAAYMAHKFRPGGPESMELRANWQK